MTSVKVRLRKSAVKGKAGTVFYQISHKLHCWQISTKMRIPYEFWDKEKEEISEEYAQESPLRIYKYRIENDVRLLLSAVESVDRRRAAFSPKEVSNIFHSASSEKTVLAFLKEQTEYLMEAGCIGTARNYTKTMNSFSAFLCGEDLGFSLFNESIVEDYALWLQGRGVINNTVSFYMRVLRSVYNKAVKKKFTSPDNPFCNVYTGVARTRKRAVDDTIVLKLQSLKLEAFSAMELARDLFVFSFSTRGMAFVDMAYLRKEQIVDNMIIYERHKTKQQLSIRIEPCMKVILLRYWNINEASPYVFPILTSSDKQEAFMQYQTHLRQYNRLLKKLSEKINITAHITSYTAHITSYTARHTWATVARNKGIPLSVISAGMGHTSEKTTQIYLASIENSIIDNANNAILKDFNLPVSN